MIDFFKKSNLPLDKRGKWEYGKHIGKEYAAKEETIMTKHSFAVEYYFSFAYYFKGKAYLSFTENGSNV